MRNSRREISAKLFYFENHSRCPGLNFSVKMGMSEQQYEQLKLQRMNAWRGFVNREDFHTVLR